MRYGRQQGSNLTPLWGIMIICLLIYIALLINNQFLMLLGLQTATFLAKPWTIVTNLFTHASLWHLLANMFTLYFFGSYLLRLLGVGRFMTVYFGGGLLGNIFFMLLGSPYAIVIGASGAIFALGGLLTVLQPKLKVYMFPIPVPLPLWVAIIGGFVVLSLFPHVAWQGHLGGLVFGVIAGFVLRRKMRFFR